MAIAFAGLFAGLFHPAHLFNGQYILIRQAVYHQSRGFAAVSNEPMEDLALGSHLRRSGYQVAVLRGETAASVQSYRDLKHLWSGLTRLGSGSLKWLGPGAGLTMLFITALMFPVLLMAGWLIGRLSFKWVALTWGTAVLSLLPWTFRAGILGCSWLAPLGALLVQSAATWGLIQKILGRGVKWKGRKV
jgi:hypothetical protein